jgi:hypothetical protein
MNIADVAALLGPNIKSKTVSTYLYESQAQIGRGERQRRGRYADHPFPAPNGHEGKAPWWRIERQAEILAWAASRPGQGARTDRFRSSD